ncbi:MAG: hypothetical protein HYS38_02660 [Acidobacteria bacterium]|nr:hypothetical protein [Acidobacteriota bacterium]
MKHKFLLDENILHFAIKGINDQGHDDPSAGELIRLIGQNCHSIAVNAELWDHYWQHLPGLLKAGASAPAPLLVINLLKTSHKLAWESSDLPEVPQEARIPRKDIYIVQLALVTKALIVTTDRPLKDAVLNYPAFGLTAFTPGEALELAKET